LLGTPRTRIFTFKKTTTPCRSLLFIPWVHMCYLRHLVLCQWMSLKYHIIRWYASDFHCNITLSPFELSLYSYVMEERISRFYRALALLVPVIVYKHVVDLFNNKVLIEKKILFVWLCLVVVVIRWWHFGLIRGVPRQSNTIWRSWWNLGIHALQKGSHTSYSCWGG